jgi:hypothetical protein
MKDLIKCYCGHTTTCDCGPEEPKKNFYCGDEVDYDDKCLKQCENCNNANGVDYGYIEDAALINYKKLYEGEPLTQDVPIDAFKQGAKWQQERSYSEEDMRKAFIAGGNSFIEEDDAYGSEYHKYMEKWFEQFKKK